MESGIQVPLRKTGIQYLESGIRNPESVTWNSESKSGWLGFLTWGERSPKKTGVNLKRTLASSNENTATSRPRTFDRTHISLCQALR